MGSDHILLEWHKDDLAILKYKPRRSGGNEITDFVIAFKNGQKDIIDHFGNLVVELLSHEDIEAELRYRRSCRYIVAIPGHANGSPKGSPCEMVCQHVAEQIDWLTHLPHVLLRTKTVKKAAFSVPWDRPTLEDHRASIRYTYQTKNEFNYRDNFIMFDDIITRGSTSAACREIIIEATGRTPVTGLYLARTQK